MAQTFCPNCRAFTGTQLSCAACGALVNAVELQQLAMRAQAASAANDLVGARALWAQSLPLLPEDTLQHRSISAKIAELDAQIAAGPPKKDNPFAKGAAGLGPLAIAAWKFKALFLGLTKLSTLLSMFASLGVYWALYGWKFAAGIVVSIYIHEMGHVLALRGYGIQASAPMFIPGFGAFIRLRGGYIDPVQDARVGLAGPIYGFGAAVAALALYFATGEKTFAAIAQFGAVINLFNLIPIWQLDGSRGFHSLTRNQRMIILGITLVLWFITSESMLFLIALGCGYRVFFTKDAALEPDDTCLRQYAGLLAALAAIGAFAVRFVK